MKRLACACALAFSLCIGAYAQKDGSVSGQGCAIVCPFMALDQSPVATALGGASLGNSGDLASAAFSAPSTMLFSDQTFAVRLDNQTWRTLPTDYVSASFAWNIDGRYALCAATATGIDRLCEMHNSMGQVIGMFRPYSMQFIVGGAAKISPSICFGLNIGYVQDCIFKGLRTHVVSGDIYVSYNRGPLTVTAGGRSIGHAMPDSDDMQAIPTRFSAGGCYEFKFSEDYSLKLLADAEMYIGKALGVIYRSSGNLPFETSLGVEVGYGDMFFVRGGWHYDHAGAVPSYFSLGTGIVLKRIRIDLGYIRGYVTKMNNFNTGISFSF